MALEASRTAVSMAAKIVAAHGLNAWPCSSTPPGILAQGKKRKGNAIEIGSGAGKGERNDNSPQDFFIRHGEHHNQLNDGPDRGQNGTGRGRQKKIWLLRSSRTHDRNCCRAGNKTRRESGDRKAETGAGEPYRDVAEGTDRHDEDDDDPDRVGIKGAERPHWVIRQERQYNQRGGSEDQGIPDLIVA